MTMFTPGDRSEKIGMTLDSLVASEAWGEIWRATHDTHSRVLVVAYKREEGKNLFLAAREGFDTWKRLAESGKPGLLKIHKIVSSGKIPMLVVEDPGGETAREFFSSEAATLKKTARMVRDCCRTLTAARSERLLPIGMTPDTIIRKEGEKDYPSYLIPVSPGVFGDAVRLGEGRYISPDALLLGDRERVNADIYSLAWIWAELLARNHNIDHQTSRLRDTVHYPKLREIIRKALVFRDDKYLDPKKLEFEAEQWLENDATSDREAYDLWAEEQKKNRRKRRREKRKKAVEESPAASASPQEDEPGGTGEEFGDGGSQYEEEEDELAFANDIPPLAEPSAPRPAPAGDRDAPPVNAAPAASGSGPRQDSSTGLFPVLLSGCFIFVIISAFSAGMWLLLAGGDDEQLPRQVASLPQESEEAVLSEEPEAVPTAPRADPEPETSPEPTPNATSTPSPESAADPPEAPQVVPDSVDSLLSAFREANRQRDMDAIRALYFENREFDAVKGVLDSLGAENGELATLNFVERTREPSPDAEIEGVGMLRVSTSAFNLEIPVGREGDRFFLTSVGRVGERPPSRPTPEPTEEPLEYVSWTRGAWPESGPGRRLFRIGLGIDAQAAVVLNRTPGGEEPFDLSATITNPLTENLYYQYAIEVADTDGRLITVGSGGGMLEGGTGDIHRKGEFISGEGLLEAADSYEARWYEANVPLGLVGGRVIRNPRIPVGFGRGYLFQMGDNEQVQGRIYTEYLNNQKVIAAPVLLRNNGTSAIDAVCAVAFYDTNGRFVSGRSQRARVEPNSIKPFDNLISVLPQAAYGEVESFQAVMVIDGKEFGRAAATLPMTEAGEDPITVAAPTPAPTARATPTPLPASAAADSTRYRSPEEEMTVEEALALMDEPGPSEELGSAAAGDWTEVSELEAGDETSPAPVPFSEEDVERFSRIASGLGTASTIISIVFGYFIAAFCFQKILEKTGKKDLALVAWIPFVNWFVVPWLISGRSAMFLVLAMAIPCLGVFFYIAMWYDVCVARNKNGAWAFVVFLLPILGIPYLAFSE